MDLCPNNKLNINKICKILDITLSELLDGLSLLETLNPNETVMTNGIKESKLISDYRQLNEKGKKEALKRVEELTEIPKYTQKKPNKPSIIAAHNDNILDEKELENIERDIKKLKIPFE